VVVLRAQGNHAGRNQERSKKNGFSEPAHSRLDAIFLPARSPLGVPLFDFRGISC
jgi:hypothetical protein